MKPLNVDPSSVLNAQLVSPSIAQGMRASRSAKALSRPYMGREKRSPAPRVPFLARSSEIAVVYLQYSRSNGDCLVKIWHLASHPKS